MLEEKTYDRQDEACEALSLKTSPYMKIEFIPVKIQETFWIGIESNLFSIFDRFTVHSINLMARIHDQVWLVWSMDSHCETQCLSVCRVKKKLWTSYISLRKFLVSFLVGFLKEGVVQDKEPLLIEMTNHHFFTITTKPIDLKAGVRSGVGF